jgi:nitronate monooxygenase
MIVESDGQDTVFTEVFDIISGNPWPAGVAERVRRSRTINEWSGRERELREQLENVRSAIAEGRARQDPEVIPVLMGQSAGFVPAVRPAAEVIESICADAERILRRRTLELGL